MDILEKLERDYADLISKASGIKQAIDAIKNQGVSIQTLNKVEGSNAPLIQAWYDNNASNKVKIMNMLKHEHRFLHIREMAKIAGDHEPSVGADEFLKKFSPALSALKNEGRIVNIKAGKSLVNTFWGSNKWLDEHGEPKNGYKYNEEYVSGNNKDEIEL
jgi:hypothetical protein